MAPQMDLRITIGGDAGQGVESSGSGFALAFARAGHEVYAQADYRSRIRGGHNFYQIRMTDRPVYAMKQPTHVLIALTAETVHMHLDHMIEGGAVVYDQSFKVDEAAIRAKGVRPIAAPIVKIAEEAGNRVAMNTAALAVAAGLLEFPFSFMEDVIRHKFGRKSKKTAELNQVVGQRAHALALTEYAPGFPYKIPAAPYPAKRMLISGNEAFAMGAVAGGCRFIAAYPMTPATTILEWMTAQADRLGIVTKHAEDEIAAVCMAIGAAFAGARAMTSTSGGGFDLMAEALGMAGMCEVPLVVAEVQRGGPSTGLPTRTEQSDLLYVIHASHGEYPRIVLTPGTIEEYFEAGWRAFNLAERYQTPVIVLSDLLLAGAVRTLPMDALQRQDVRIDRGEFLTAQDLNALQEPYMRYAMTESGISPRAIPGHPKAVYASSTDEHDEEGHITEEIDVRIRMMAKRMRKLETARAEMRGPKLIGPEEAPVTLITWGSTVGAAREAVLDAHEAGETINVLHFTDMWPLPVDQVQAALAKTRRTVCVEMNYTAQFAHLLRMTTGHQVDDTILKYDGRPFTPGEILDSLHAKVGVTATP